MSRDASFGLSAPHRTALSYCTCKLPFSYLVPQMMSQKVAKVNGDVLVVFRQLTSRRKTASLLVSWGNSRTIFYLASTEEFPTWIQNGGSHMQQKQQMCLIL